MEEKLAKLSAGIAGGSIIVTGLGLIVLFGVPHLFSGDVAIKLFVLKALVIASVYIYSLYLVATIPGKPVQRRALSWGFSILFHSCLLIYLGVYNDWGNIIFFIGMVETAILLFSLIGMGLLIYGHYNKPIA
ncbi:MAG: hypothetical protein JAZ15_18890 [Candidatus Thiodiazotropha endolucinida]|nr:hypothetical protein [Candidatus Thiodiazotropha taylori]MCW4315088.1 hypothetical protein [Candidatus Thiodiazotropha taylori]